MMIVGLKKKNENQKRHHTKICHYPMRLLRYRQWWEQWWMRMAKVLKCSCSSWKSCSSANVAHECTEWKFCFGTFSPHICLYNSLIITFEETVVVKAVARIPKISFRNQFQFLSPHECNTRIDPCKLIWLPEIPTERSRCNHCEQPSNSFRYISLTKSYIFVLLYWSKKLISVCNLRMLCQTNTWFFTQNWSRRCRCVTATRDVLLAVASDLESKWSAIRRVIEIHDWLTATAVHWVTGNHGQ